MTVGAYTGGTVTINGGTFSSTATSDGFNPSTKSIVINNGGKLNGLNNGMDNSVIVTVNTGGTFDLLGNSDVIGSITGAGTLTNTGAAQALQFDMPSSQTFDGQITGAVRLNLVGRLTGTGTARSLTLSNTSNNFTGNININSTAASITGDVSLVLGNSDVITDTAVVTVNGSATASSTGSYVGILDMNGKSETIGGLAGGAPTGTGTRSGSITNNSAVDSALTLNVTGTQDFGGIISDGATNKLSLVKSGAGTQTLSGVNTYTGTTTISEGTLAANAANALQSTTAINVNGGSLLIGVSDAINNSAGVTMGGGKIEMAAGGGISETVGALTLNANSTLDFGTASVNSITFSGTLVIHESSPVLNILNWTEGAGVAGDHLYITSSAVPNANNFGFNNLTGNAFVRHLSGTSYEIIAVPEPGTILAGALLLGGLFFFERKRIWEKLKAKS